MVNEQAVAEAMRTVDRREFLPTGQRRWSDEDRPLPIGHGQTNSQPRTVVDMLRLLGPEVGMRVLDVGAGSGWTTALLARLVGPAGSVTGVELVPALARWGAENLRRQHTPWAALRLAQRGVLGWPDDAPYDRILVSAGAKEIPQELVEQLGHDAVMVLVVAGTLLRLQCAGGSEPSVTRHGSYRFVPLR